jgi:hypothetical protein
MKHVRLLAIFLVLTGCKSAPREKSNISREENFDTPERLDPVESTEYGKPPLKQTLPPKPLLYFPPGTKIWP